MPPVTSETAVNWTIRRHPSEIRRRRIYALASYQAYICQLSIHRRTYTDRYRCDLYYTVSGDNRKYEFYCLNRSRLGNIATDGFMKLHNVQTNRAPTNPGAYSMKSDFSSSVHFFYITVNRYCAIQSNKNCYRLL